MLIPFSNYQENPQHAMEWWTAYNRVKLDERNERSKGNQHELFPLAPKTELDHLIAIS